ncbi:putative Universal stress protein [Nitrospira sp. KM1]|uniref:universal stress protein n=1 Tax=Nitrospira sp. KM1 TaxID=1936990 RepID=UPI0013A72125|nr:universal stress protein [Nitrospira sp. KM1]BCA54932.1 putative Universal stress protein [Nitrospira sp. KM1]
MKIVIGVDWSDESIATVHQVLQLYRPLEITLVHGIDLGIFKYPALVQIANLQGYDDYRAAVTTAGQEILESTANAIRLESCSVKKINEIGNAADLIIRTARTVNADLIAVGSRNRNRATEAILGSVSHRVLLQADRPTLVVKGDSRPIHEVLVAVEGQEDADYLRDWLLKYPFLNSVRVRIVNVVVPLKPLNPYPIPEYGVSNTAMTDAEDLVRRMAAALQSPQYNGTTRVLVGGVVETVAAQSREADLVVVASHGRRGLERFLLGSASHAIAHRVRCPILVVR